MYYMATFTKTSTKKDPELWDSVVSEVKEMDKYGTKGQWNARKASYAVQLYKEKGGEYEGDSPDINNNSLKKWLDEDWKTFDGKPSIKKNEKGEVIGVSRYLPAKAWDELSPQQKAATNRKKYQAYKEGRQFAPNAKAAKEASRKAREFTYVSNVVADFSLLSYLPDIINNIQPTPQMVRSASNLMNNLDTVSDVLEPVVKTGLRYGKKVHKGYKTMKPAISQMQDTSLSSILPKAKALATTLPSPREYMSTMKVF